TPYVNFLPPEILMFDESKMLVALRNHPPDFVLLTARSMGEYGVKPFGTDPGFGKQIMDWVKLNYSLVEQIAADPEAKHPFDIKILRRAPE
ncbi:MAG TPA: hypothetical protein VMT78_13525, partial [Terriglobia bacterium]|nr:hypothetical protein [Terriglobia bacterium]